LSIGKLIRKKSYSETNFAVNGGPQPLAKFLYSADYKHGEILKSCH